VTDSQPQAQDCTLQVDENNGINNSALSGSLSSYVTDAGNASLTYQVVAPPSDGTVTVNAVTGAFTYAPNQYSTGPTHSFTR